MLVTGASGFIGSAVVKTLSREPDIEVIATCRDASPNLLAVAQPSDHVSILDQCDLTRAADVARIPGDLTHVIHAMAYASFEATDRTALTRANVQATKNLVEHFARTSVDTLQRLVFASSIGVHDRSRTDNLDSPITEESPFAPQSIYGETKAAAEQIITACGQPWVSARLGWVYGPEMRRKSHIRVFAGMCRKKHPATWFDLPGRVMVAYIEDVADALKSLTFHQSLGSQAYLMAHPEPVAIGRIFRLCHEILGNKALPVVPASFLKPFRLFGASLPMSARTVLEDYLVCSVGKLAAEGISLTSRFEDGLRKSVEKGKWFAG